MFKSVALVFLAGLGASSITGKAAAQTAPRALPRSNSVLVQPILKPIQYPQVGGFELLTVPYLIQAPNRSKSFIVATERGEPFALCTGDCLLRLPFGTYKLIPLDAQRKVLGKAEFEVSGAARLEYTEPDPGLAVTGAVMGSVGAMLAIVGVLSFGSSICINECEDKGHRAAYGLGELLIGAVLTPTGWIMYRQYGRTRTNEHSLGAPKLAISGTRDGAVFGVTGDF